MKSRIVISVPLALLMLSSCFLVEAVFEAPPIQWQQFFEGNHGYSLLQTEDGGYVIAGVNSSTTLLIRTDSFGNLSWIKTYQIGEKDTHLFFLDQTKNGGYALAGTLGNQFVLLKVDSEGNRQWNQTYSYDTPFIYLSSFDQTSDQGYAIVGTFSPPQDPIYHTMGQIWFVKTNDLGELQWNKTIVGQIGNFANSVLQTSDGGYAIIGTSWASDFLPSTFKLIKTDSEGNVQWNKTYGGTGKFYSSESFSGIVTRDEGYLLSGNTGYFGNAWLVKTDYQGTVMWNKTYGGEGSVATSVVQTHDGGYVFTGVLNWTDAWVVKTDAEGNMEWNLTFVGSSFVGSSIEEFGKSMILTDDGGYALVGTKNEKIWLFKLAALASSSSPFLQGIIAIVIVAAIIGLLVVAFILRKLIFKNS